jgi:D-amino-acid oxidase
VVRVSVVGAGVIGLSCATVLAEAGAAVHVIARELPLQTTSAIAAAIWHPYRAFPYDRVTAWARTTYEELVKVARVERASGVRLRSGTELRRSHGDQPWWAAALPGLLRADAEGLPNGYAQGWTFETPVVEMPIYLAWLADRAQRAGVTMQQERLSAWPEEADLVVDATGLTGTALTGDTTLYPIRGQVVYVDQIGLTRWWLDEAGPTYLVPRSADIVVGGTDAEHDWSTTPEPDVTRAIIDRAAEIVPAIADARVLGTRVGLRPARAEVRLEREERLDGPPVVHCYGHGGAGVTLSWGCAMEVHRLALETADR